MYVEIALGIISTILAARREEIIYSKPKRRVGVGMLHLADGKFKHSLIYQGHLLQSRPYILLA